MNKRHEWTSKNVELGHAHIFKLITSQVIIGEHESIDDGQKNAGKG